MANIYVRSTDGDNLDSGATWALAKANAATAATIDASGDSVYFSQVHSESTTAASTTMTFQGTKSTPVRLLCANDAAEPPTTLATTASLVYSGNLSINGIFYAYGLNFTVGSGTTAVSLTLCNSAGDEVQQYDNCSFWLDVTGATTAVLYTQITTGAYGKYTEFNDCTFRFSSTGGRINCVSRVVISGGGFAAGSVTPAYAFSGNSGADLLVKGFDFSQLDSTLVLVSGSIYKGKITLLNCKLPANWTGTLVTGVPGVGARVSMYNCDDGATNYQLWINAASGGVRSETTIVKTGGASDGTTPLSWKLTGNTYASELDYMETDPIAVWIDSTGTSKTITVDFVHDSVTALTDAEIWLEVDYLGSSTYPISTRVTDKRATVLTTPASHPASTATWTTTGLTNPNKQKLEVTFTPQMKGFAYAKVCLAKASSVVYVDYEPTVA